MKNDLKKIGIVVLAAGSSARLGEPKQLLSYQHKSLLDTTTDAAKKVAFGRVVVILGGNYEKIERHINHTGVKVVYNPDWEQGMSTSIRTGLQHVMQENKELDAVILTVCDQPLITGEVFAALVERAQSTGKGIIASAYSGTLGVPVLFSKYHFADLALLNGEQGAKKLLERYKDELASVPFEDGAVDIDTPEDYIKLINKNITE